MKLTRRLTFLRGPVDTAPLANVILLLLIFFMLGSTFVLQPGIKVELPRSAWGTGVPAQSHIVTVLLEPERRDPATGQVLPRAPFLFFNDEIMNLPDLEARLERLGKDHPGQTLVIKADREVPNGLIVEIMNVAMSEKWSVVLATQRLDAPDAPDASNAPVPPSP